MKPGSESGPIAFMEKPAETKEEAKRSGGFGIYLIWVCAALVVYVLSVGPFLMMAQKGISMKRGDVARSCLDTVYAPLGWAYQKTPLHKPLGTYFHLWSPKRFDQNGDIK
jgi:hypothetical protein